MLEHSSPTRYTSCCVGETREQREAGEAQAVVATQLQGALQGQPELAGLVVAYEPVWAIGTGLTATPEQAQEMHAFIRAGLGKCEGVDADAVRILYGGSVKPANAAELFSQPDIDGALVGGAALQAADFLGVLARRAGDVDVVPVDVSVRARWDTLEKKVVHTYYMSFVPTTVVLTARRVPVKSWYQRVSGEQLDRAIDEALRRR